MMNEPMRRKERELSRDEAEAILARGEYGVLCTCGAARAQGSPVEGSRSVLGTVFHGVPDDVPEALPYGVPVSYVFVDGCIAFHSAPAGHKVRNLRENPWASFTVVGRTELLPAQFSTLYESAVAFGRVAEAEGEHKRSILRALVAKYSPAFREKGEAYIAHDADKVAVFVLKPECLSGKAHR